MKPSLQAIAVLTSLSAATSALAVPTGAHWVQVDNSGNAKDGPNTGFDASWLTFDLYVDVQPNDTVSVGDFGGAGPNAGLSTDGVFFQADAPFGSDDHITNLTFVEFAANIEYDTAAALGGETLATTGPFNWDPAGVVGTWFSATAGAAVPGPSVHLARVTVSADTTFLGGEFFVSGFGPNGKWPTHTPSALVVYIPNAIPTPGAMIVFFSFTGATAIRRKRKNIGALQT